MSKKKEYPGYLLYFDRIEGFVEECTDEEFGIISKAMFYYARDRKEPTELPKVFRIAWPVIRRMLDEDRAAYEDKCRSAAYSATVKASKAKGEPAPDRKVFDSIYDKQFQTGQPMSQQEFDKEKEKRIRMLDPDGSKGLW